MTDIASLGLAIDSRPAATAAASLDKLTVSAKAAGVSSDALEKSSKTQASAHAGLSTQAMAAQHSIRSLVEAMAQGVPLSQALGMQLNHLSYAATGPGGIAGAFKQAGGAILGMLNPATAVALAIAAIGGGTYYAISSVAALAKQFDDTSRAAGITIDNLHGLEKAASLKGIDTSEFLKSMDKFGADVYDAQHNMGQLAQTFRAAGQNAKTFTDYLSQVANRIQNAASDAERLKFLQEAGLPANMQWVRFMQQGGDAIKRAADEAAKFDTTAEGQLVARAREFDEKWNAAWKNWADNAKSATLTVAGFIDSVIDKFKAGMVSPSQGQALLTGSEGLKRSDYGPTNPVTTPVKTLAERQKELSDAQTQIGLLGQLATVDQQVKQAQLGLDAAYLSGGVGIGKQRDALLNLTRATAENTLVQNQAQAGVFNLDQANQAAAHTLQSWIDRKLLDPNKLDEMAAASNVAAKSVRALSDSAQVAASNLPQLTQLGLDAGNVFKQFDTFGVSATNALSSALVDIGTHSVSAADGFRQFGLTVLKSLEQMIVQLTIIKPLMSALGFSGGLGSLFGFSNGGLVDGGSSSNPLPGLSAADYGPGFASGGFTGFGGKFQPAGVVHRGEYVMDSVTTSRIGVRNLDKLRGYAGGGYVDGGGSMSSPSVTIINNNDFRGADPGSEARINQRIEQMGKQSVEQAVRQVASIKGTSPSYLRASR